MTDSYIFIVGASRGVGREVAKCLTARDIKVKALLRDVTHRVELEALGVAVAMGDALNPHDLESAMLGGEPIHAVVSTLSGLPQDGIRADYVGNKYLIDVAVRAGVQKFLLVSSIGCGNSVRALQPHVLQALSSILLEKEKAESHLIASGLTYTIIRPGGLKSEPATGRGILTENPGISGFIHRADVANLVCQCLTSDRANNKVFSAVDLDAIFGQIPVEEFAL